MEAVAVTASIIAIIQISDRVINCCRFFIQAASDTPSDLRAILVEISTLKCVLETLQFLESCEHASPALWAQLSGHDGPIEECKRSIIDLERLFPAGRDPTGRSRSGSKGRKREIIQKALASLAWPLKAGRAKELLQNIIQQKALMSLALTAESSQDIKAIKRDTAQIRHVLTESQRQEVYRWLVQTDPSSIHNRNRELHDPTTSNWMVHSEEWEDWLAGDERCIRIHGIPGAGKTILTSFLVEQIKGYCKNRERVAYAYYYCYFGHNQDEASPFLRWVISQLCRQADSIPDRVFEMYRKGQEPSLTELLSATEDSLKNFNMVYVIIDAVDESKPRKDLLKVLRDLTTDARFSKIRCMITSREYTDIEEALDPISCSIPMSNNLVKRDIRKHVRSILRSRPRFQRWPVDLRTEVEEVLADRSKGMFRWAVCQLERLQRLKCEPSIIKNALATLPKTLDETYERIFLDIHRDDWLFAHHVLRWICFHQDLYESRHPMTLQILLAATELSTCNEHELDTGLEYDSERICDMLSCLVTIEAEGYVRLAHYTVKEYLESQRIMESATSYFWIGRGGAMNDYMRIILRGAQAINLTDKQNRQRNRPERSSPERFHTPVAFLEDFSVYCTASGAILLYERQEDVASDEMLLQAAADFVNPTRDQFFDMARISELFDKVSFYPMGFANMLALFSHWYSRTGCEEAGILFQFLLIAKGSPTPILADAFSRNKNIGSIAHSEFKFDMCLGYDFQEPWIEDIRYTFEGSLLEVAAQVPWVYEGHFVWLLNQCDMSAKTGVLLGAITKCSITQYRTEPHHCAVREVLRRHANPNCAGYQATPLQVAVSIRNLAHVKMLLEAGADPNASGDRNGTAIKNDSIFETFVELQGQSPLNICRNFKFRMWHYNDNVVEEAQRKIWARAEPLIEDLLLQYGAEDFNLLSSPIEPRRFS